jgi:serine phosphatase RsbU (regulator of sigma subunit)/PAS domain-containing protein
VGAQDRDEQARLAALAGWQRAELDRLRTEAAIRSVTDRATGMLMERLGCPAEEARQQLARLATEAGVSEADIAADIAGENLAVPAPARRATILAAAAAAAAPDAARLAQALLAEALAAEGAEAIAVWLLAPDGGLELAGEAGFGPREASRWRRVPPDMPFLPLRAMHQDTEIWLAAGQTGGDDGALIGGRPGRARAIVPLRQAGTCFGALEVCWPTPLKAFGESVRRQLTALAGPCAQALAAGATPGTYAADYSRGWAFGLLDGLLRSVLFARALRGQDGSLTGLVIEWASDGFLDPQGRAACDVTGRRLLEVYPEAASPGGLFDAAARVLASGEPCRLGGVRLTADGPRTEISVARIFDGVVIAWQDAGEAGLLEGLLDLAQQLGNTGAWEENLVTGQVQWSGPAYALFGLPPRHPVRLADLHQRVPAEDVPAVRAFRDRAATQPGTVTASFRVIRADDFSVRQLRAVAQPVTGADGGVIAVRGAYQDVSDRYYAQATITATHEQLVQTEERAREEHKLALRLQQAITPLISEPVETAGIEVAARYRPAGQAHLVGGDWYDAVRLPGKGVLLAVGDVAGHGSGAVTGMVALRNHLRGLAVTGATPAALLTWLNSAAFHLAGVMATVICGIYEPDTRTLRWARAGHLPPLLIRGGEARLQTPPEGTLLGVDPDAAYEEATLRLQTGDSLVLFTDGLVERRHEPLDRALDHLARLASRPAGDIGAFADSLLAGAPSDTGDDTCLLAVSIR